MIQLSPISIKDLSCSLSKSLSPGPGVSEQERYRRDQVLWTATCPSGDSDAGSHDSPRQRTHLGRGQEAAR